MSASWLKRALVTSALAAGAMMLSGGVAHAGDLPGGAPDPVSSILQDQTASDTYSTDHDADASSSTDQVNINAPISILSSGANGGDEEAGAGPGRVRGGGIGGRRGWRTRWSCPGTGSRAP